MSRSEFGEAVKGIRRAALADDWSIVRHGWMDLVMRRLAHEARRTGLTEGAVGPEDAASIALVRFLKAVAAGRVNGDTPDLYLLSIVRHAAIDALRRLKPVVTEREEGQDDRVLRLIDLHASQETVIAALKMARLAGDRTALDTATEFLNMASLTGAAPTTRELAKRLGTSHTSVRRALKRFRDYLPSTAEP